MKITHSQIAQELGVSRSLVSSALNGTGRVGQGTRKKIERIAGKLGYRPNMLVRGIQTGKTMTVGVVMHTQGAFSGEIQSGIQDTLEPHGYLPLILSESDKLTMPTQMIRLIDQRVDGIIIRPRLPVCPKTFSKILGYDIPIVVIDDYIKGFSNLDFAGSDDISIGKIAAEYFLQMGHKNLMVVSVLKHLHYTRRIEGFQRAIAKTSGAQSGVIEQENPEDAVKEACRIVAQKNGPTALFFVADVMAASFINQALKHGILIPKDVSIIGVSNSKWGRYTTPPLTVIEQFPYNIGRNAVELLFQRINNKNTSKNSQYILERPELVIRESVTSPTK